MIISLRNVKSDTLTSSSKIQLSIACIYAKKLSRLNIKYCALRSLGCSVCNDKKKFKKSKKNQKITKKIKKSRILFLDYNLPLEILKKEIIKAKFGHNRFHYLPVPFSHEMETTLLLANKIVKGFSFCINAFWNSIFSSLCKHSFIDFIFNLTCF